MKQLYNSLSAVNTILQKAEKFLGCVCLGLLFFVMIVNAALRYCFGSGLNWSDELNGFLFVWFGFFAAAHAMSTNSHLNITALINAFPKTVQYVLRTVMNIIMIATFIIYMPALSKLLKTLPISNVMRVPLDYVYIILPVAFALMCYHVFFNLVRDTYQFVHHPEREEGKKR